MKIALIYTPRSGSTSILRYFKELKTDYVCYNEPWFNPIAVKEHGKVIEYNDVLKNENVFVKSSSSTLPVPLEQIINDFDKVIFLMRKNKKEQVESAIIVSLYDEYTNYSKRKYWLESLNDNDIKEFNKIYDTLNERLTEASITHNIKLLYYEDLYYDDFTPLFDELGLYYDNELFDKLLNVKNRYKEDIFTTKKHKTLI